MAVPRIFLVCSALALMLMLVSFQQAFYGVRPADPSKQPMAMPTTLNEEPHRVPTSGADVQPAVVTFSPKDPAVGSRAATNARVPAVGVNMSAPLMPVTSVPASAQHGRLSSGCQAYTDPKRQQLLHMLPAAIPAADGGRPGCLQATLVCEALRHAFLAVGGAKRKRRQVVVTAAAHAQVGMLRIFTQATAALRLPTLVLAMDEDAFAAARTTTATALLVPAGGGRGRDEQTALHRKWAALAEILEAGAALLWADVDAVIAADPFPFIAADSDVEALSEGWEEPFLRGFVMGSDDPSMGWSRYCESMRAAMLSPSLLYLEPTTVARNLAEAIAARAVAWPSAPGYAWDAATNEATELSMELLMPAHDGTARGSQSHSQSQSPPVLISRFPLLVRG